QFTLFLPLSFFDDTVTTEIHTLSLHDALPISNSAIYFPVSSEVLLDGTGDVLIQNSNSYIYNYAGTNLTIGADIQVGPCVVENVDRKSTRLNSSHSQISYAVFCLKKKKNRQ